MDIFYIYTYTCICEKLDDILKIYEYRRGIKLQAGQMKKEKKKGMLTKTLFPRLSRMCSDRQKSRPPTGHGVSIAHSLHICKNRNSSIRHARSPYKNQSPYIANIDHIFFSIREKAEEKAKGTGALLS